MHFGGSRPSVTLHTEVAYSRDFKQSFCTIPESQRHDAAAIAAHLPEWKYKVRLRCASDARMGRI